MRPRGNGNKLVGCVIVASLFLASDSHANLAYPPLSVPDFLKAGQVTIDAAFVYTAQGIKSPTDSAALRTGEGVAKIDVGIAKDLSLGVAFPYAAIQNSTINGVSTPTQSGYGDLSAGLKYRAIGDCCNSPFSLVFVFDATADMAEKKTVTLRRDLFSPGVFFGGRIGVKHDWFYGGYRYSFTDGGDSTRIHNIVIGLSRQFTETLGLNVSTEYSISTGEQIFWRQTGTSDSFSSVRISLDAAYRLGQSNWFVTPRVSAAGYNRDDRYDLSYGIGFKTVFGGGK
jgi:hypothetical protein